MRMVTMSLAALVVAGGPLAASAQESDRYALEKSGDGFVRMDRQSGEMAYCTVSGDGLACKPATEGEAVPAADIARLQEAIAALDRRMVKLENSLAQRLESSLPTDEDFEKTLGYMERFLRSFMGVVKDLEKDDLQPPAPDPQKT